MAPPAREMPGCNARIKARPGSKPGYSSDRNSQQSSSPALFPNPIDQGADREQRKRKQGPRTGQGTKQFNNNSQQQQQRRNSSSADTRVTAGEAKDEGRVGGGEKE
ncbi:hypothetical protein ASPVEDRAFT_30248 [Aspergillus versicolor CBS 583.65]|uniref:Uncharacterized protein n=1 Tax=Aspergillus versicolor CBS 583.65 TaxID=1036611 RepID=A0A1L9PQF5_ASPVE|nr:uncharacterized protein ASPVEDRAFT_30248 [Aspergillus versicolor CBS 583.65]OJJ03750.1 hypothetical protein ASPVEDRAFT_30248 [Aspergillus versicolor CBS 583.65]